MFNHSVIYDCLTFINDIPRNIWYRDNLRNSISVTTDWPDPIKIVVSDAGKVLKFKKRARLQQWTLDIQKCLTILFYINK
jgi:hypothetical protein